MDQGVLALSLNKETIKPLRKQFIVYIPEVRSITILQYSA